MQSWCRLVRWHLLGERRVIGGCTVTANTRDIRSKWMVELIKRYVILHDQETNVCHVRFHIVLTCSTYSVRPYPTFTITTKKLNIDWLLITDACFIFTCRLHKGTCTIWTRTWRTWKVWDSSWQTFSVRKRIHSNWRTVSEHYKHSVIDSTKLNWYAYSVKLRTR